MSGEDRAPPGEGWDVFPMMASSWIGGSPRRLSQGCVVHYVTHVDHVDDEGRLFPKGTHCLALRSARGELGLLFVSGAALASGFEESRPRRVASVVWLPEGYGLCGVEPHVLDPEKTNHLMVAEACRAAVARVFRELEPIVERVASALEIEMPREALSGSASGGAPKRREKRREKDGKGRRSKRQGRGRRVA